MNVYKLLQLNRIVKNHRIKFLGLYLLHRFRQRYLAVNIDPIMACNLRCQMCHFSDPKYSKTTKGQFTESELHQIANTVFKRAIKLQVGCATEPTLYKHLETLISLGRTHGIPYIALTTNANVLKASQFERLLELGLNEVTISLHGVTKATYEKFMERGSYESFCETLKALNVLKAKYRFKIRINYTFNKDNFSELEHLFEYFDGNSFDILQLRPIQNIGDTVYSNFDLSELSHAYTQLIAKIKQSCKTHHSVLLAPKSIPFKEQLNASSFIFNFTYFYISPKEFWKPGYNWKEESFEAYSKRIGWRQQLWRQIFKSQKEFQNRAQELNYDIDFY